jgi:hypothetical protein
VNVGCGRTLLPHQPATFSVIGVSSFPARVLSLLRVPLFLALQRGPVVRAFVAGGIVRRGLIARMGGAVMGAAAASHPTRGSAGTPRVVEFAPTPPMAQQAARRGDSPASKKLVTP